MLTGFFFRPTRVRKGLRRMHWQDNMPDMVMTLAVFGLVIGLNNLAISLTLGAMGQLRRQGRILLVFAGFEFLVPLIGVWLGLQAARMLAAQTAWLGPLLLAGFGAFTLLSAHKSPLEREKLVRAVTSWRGLFALSTGISTDNLVVGFGLGLGGIPPLALATTIMCFSVAFAWVGLQVGHRIKRNYEAAGAALSGILLILLAGASFAGWL